MARPLRILIALAGVAASAAAIDGLGPRPDRFDIALSGVSASDDHALLQQYADAGVTWWLESIHGQRGSMSEMLDRIRAGPAMLH